MRISKISLDQDMRTLHTKKYGIRDYKGGGRSSARETAVRVAAGAIAKKWLKENFNIRIKGCLDQLGKHKIRFEDWKFTEENPFCANLKG